MELLFLMVWKMRQEIEFQKSRSQLQALLSQKGAESKEILKAFQDLRESFFPYDKNQKQDEMKNLREALRREAARGPMEIIPLKDPNEDKVKSRLKKGAAEVAKKQDMERKGGLEKIDAFDRARRRSRKPAS